MNKILVLVLASLFLGCQDNIIARRWGGSMEVVLPPGERLLNVTWKEANLWYLTRPMRADETPETYSFVEKSNFGVWQGKIVIRELRPVDGGMKK